MPEGSSHSVFGEVRRGARAQGILGLTHSLLTRGKAYLVVRAPKLRERSDRIQACLVRSTDRAKRGSVAVSPSNRGRLTP